MLNNTNIPEIEEAPEVLDIISQYHVIKNFGGGYTIDKLQNESNIEIQTLQLCSLFEAKAMEMKRKKQQFYAQEGIGW